MQTTNQLPDRCLTRFYIYIGKEKSINRTSQKCSFMKHIISIGYSLDRAADEVKSGRLPSQLLYGLWQLPADKYHVHYMSYSNRRSGSASAFKDVWRILTMKKDIIFIPYIYDNLFTFFLLFLKLVRIIRTPVVGVIHITFKKKWHSPILFRQLDMALFHSAKNLEECIALDYVRRERVALLSWGIDIAYYDNIENNPHDTSNKFLSTGIENRDYLSILNLERSLSKNIKIILPANTRDSLKQFIEENNKNAIEVEYVAQDDQLFKTLIQQSKDCLAYLIPLKKEALHYCVGHTSMVEALALGKPIIVTDNPYHPIDVEKERIGIKIKTDDKDGWSNAIKYLLSHPDIVNEMGENARKLAKAHYNIENCSRQLEIILKRLTPTPLFPRHPSARADATGSSWPGHTQQ